jgi:DNA repair ATPase RecN
MKTNKVKNNDIKIKEDNNKYDELLSQLNEEKNKNKKLLEELNNEKIKVKELNDKIKKYKNYNNEYIKKIKELEELIKSKNAEINKLKNDNNEITTIKPGEKIIAIFFTSIDQNIYRPISCKNTDIIDKIEEKIYNEYPEYKDYNTYLTVNGNKIKRLKTVEENGIKDGNIITVNIYDE